MSRVQSRARCVSSMIRRAGRCLNCSRLWQTLLRARSTSHAWACRGAFRAPRTWSGARGKMSLRTGPLCSHGTFWGRELGHESNCAVRQSAMQGCSLTRSGARKLPSPQCAQTGTVGWFWSKLRCGIREPPSSERPLHLYHVLLFVCCTLSSRGTSGPCRAQQDSSSCEVSL